MKKIINGKKYDTDTAKPVVEWNNGRNYTDFGWCSETLYRKRTGEFFLHGQGGARSIYGKWVGDCVCNGEDISPLSLEEAKEWAEENLSADKYEEIFGEVEE